MKRENRVRKHSEFDRIIKTGTAFKGHFFSCYWIRSEEGLTRIGIAVGKRNGNAVKRVRIKRQVRAMINQLWGDMSLSIDLIIVVRPSYKEDYGDGLKELEETFRKVKANFGKEN